MSGVTRADGTKLSRVWSTLLRAAVPPCLSLPGDACRNYQGIALGLSAQVGEDNPVLLSVLGPTSVLVPKLSVFLRIRVGSTGTE